MSEKLDKTINDIFDTFTDEQRRATYFLVGYTIENRRWYLAGNGEFDNTERRRLRNIYRGLNNEQREVVDILLRQAMRE